MVTGNFALLAGLDPAEVNEWYLAVYADAYEWVELPNTHGMAIHADGGVSAEALCGERRLHQPHVGLLPRLPYDVKQTTGPEACPFNALYWDFLARHERRFANNPRMAMPLQTLRKMDPAKRQALRDSAAAFLAGPEMDPAPG